MWRARTAGAIRRSYPAASSLGEQGADTSSPPPHRHRTSSFRLFLSPSSDLLARQGNGHDSVSSCFPVVLVWATIVYTVQTWQAERRKRRTQATPNQTHPPNAKWEKTKETLDPLILSIPHPLLPPRARAAAPAPALGPRWPEHRPPRALPDAAASVRASAKLYDLFSFRKLVDGDGPPAERLRLILSPDDEPPVAPLLLRGIRRRNRPPGSKVATVECRG
jgi:hypothetical protein